MYSRRNTEEPVVPAHRLGELLCGARLRQGLSLDAAANALGADWSALTLLEIETGYRSIPDQDLLALTDMYQIATAELIPSRSHLVLEIDDRIQDRGGLTLHFVGGDSDEEEVLTRYLAALYSMRDIEPGQVIPLRQPDLAVLSEALGRPAVQIEQELLAMMILSEEAVRTRGSRIRNRVLIPAIGVVVAITAVGMLLLVSEDSGAVNAVPAGFEPATAPEPAAEIPAVPVQIGDAVVQERLPDGSPGQVVTRG
ncbi:MAG: hypothetical protein WCJ04_09940 [Actinomycetes bacterium]